MNEYLPLIFASTGTFLVIGSAVITGFVVSRIEKSITKLEGEIKDCNDDLSHGDDALQRSHGVIAPADTKLLIIQLHGGQQNCGPIIAQVFKDYVQGLMYRYSAAKGESPSQETFRMWEKEAIESAKGNRESLSRLHEISNSLYLEWTERHNGILDARKEKEKIVELKKKAIVNLRDISVSLQILGLIMVLLKDVAAG